MIQSIADEFWQGNICIEKKSMMTNLRKIKQYVVNNQYNFIMQIRIFELEKSRKVDRLLIIIVSKNNLFTESLNN